MSEKQTSTRTQSDPAIESAEFNFTKPASETPRIRRRSLKAKPGGLIKPNPSALPAARELPQEAPPLTVEEAQKVGSPPPETTEKVAAKAEPVGKSATTPSAPPRTTPAVATPSQPASNTTAPKAATVPQPKAAGPTMATPVNPSSASPHGTRPATLYYSSYPRKEKEAPPMKTIPTTSSASASPTSSTAATAAAATRTATTAPRANPNVDYRANVERQSREQKSVGNILSYVVYGLIAFFVLGIALAGYGADVIFKQLHEQSVTVSDLDQRYAEANKELTAKLATTQDTLTEAQAQISRQQEVIMKQQEDLNKLLDDTKENSDAIKAEKQARAQEAASLRARIRDLEYFRTSTNQKY
jgi:hypothetical protein